MLTLRLMVHRPAFWIMVTILAFVAMGVAECDDFSTYPRG